MNTAPPHEILREWLHKLPTNTKGVAIVADTPLIEGGLLDSIGLLELVSFIEETFAVTLPLEDFVPENFATPNAVAALVERLRAAPGN